MRDMPIRTRSKGKVHSGMLAAETAYGTADILGWFFEQQTIESHIPMLNESERKDGAFWATDVTYDTDTDAYECPWGRWMKPYWRNIAKGVLTLNKDSLKTYYARNRITRPARCSPDARPTKPPGSCARWQHENDRQKVKDIAKTDAYAASSYAWKNVEMLFSNLHVSPASTISALEYPKASETSFALPQLPRTSAKSGGSGQYRRERRPTPR